MKDLYLESSNFERLVSLSGLSYQEIANKYSITRKTVYNRLSNLGITRYKSKKNI